MTGFVRSMVIGTTADEVWPTESDASIVIDSFPSLGVWIVAVNVLSDASVASTLVSPIFTFTIVVDASSAFPFTSTCVASRHAFACGAVIVS